MARETLCVVYLKGGHVKLGGGVPFGLFFSVPFSLFFSEIEVLMDGHPDRQVRSDMPRAPFETPVGSRTSKTCLSIMYWCVRYYCLTRGEAIKAAAGTWFGE